MRRSRSRGLARRATRPGETAAGSAEVESRDTILIVENNAHLHHGHYSKNFAELADGFVELGCEVEILTAFGWVGDEEHHGFRVHRYTLLGRLVSHLVFFLDWLNGIIDETRLRRLEPHLYRLRLVTITTISIFEVRWLCRRRHLDPLGILVLSIRFSIRTLERLARDENWIVYPLSSSAKWNAPRSSPDKRIMIAGASDAGPDFFPNFPYVKLNFSVGREVGGDGPALRAQLGIAPTARVLLMVGAGHWWQSARPVIDAARERSDLQLVIVGDLAKELEGERLDAWATPPIAIPRYVPIAELDGYYAAADLIAISVRERFPHDSGVLLDAASHGVPVIVSRPSTPATTVERFGAGETFDAGSSASFLSALDRHDLERAADGIAALANHFSARNVAAAYLDAIRGAASS